MNFFLNFSINSYPLIIVFFNIFLALIPCGVIFRMSKMYGRPWSVLRLSNRVGFLMLFVVWFFFFPNTAYLFTLVRHLLDLCSDYSLERVCREESWIVMFFFLYGLIGLPTFLYALKKMSALLGQVFHPKFGIYFPILMIPLTALGVLFGLIDRLNSWDIVQKPWTILQIGLSYWKDPSKFLNFAVYSIVLYLIYYGIGSLLSTIFHDDSGARHDSGASSGRVF